VHGGILKMPGERLEIMALGQWRNRFLRGVVLCELL